MTLEIPLSSAMPAAKPRCQTSKKKRTPGRWLALRATTALRSYWMHQVDWIAPCSPRPSVSISGHNAAMNSVHSLISSMACVLSVGATHGTAQDLIITECD